MALEPVRRTLHLIEKDLDFDAFVVDVLDEIGQYLAKQARFQEYLREELRGSPED